jgi:glutathione S-transferase
MPPSLLLIGQYDSPFVRRVAVALQVYGLPYEHAPWSVWSEADRVARYTPLRRVPALVLDDRETLYDSATILDALDEMTATEPLLPRTGPIRRRGLRICALATGAADKGVSLLYENLLRSQQSQTWVDRCLTQIRATLDTLESDLSESSSTPYWLGDRLSHADIAATCALRFLTEAHAPHFDIPATHPRLAALAARCEARDEFRAVTQPLIVHIRRDA